MKPLILLGNSVQAFRASDEAVARRRMDKNRSSRLIETMRLIQNLGDEPTPSQQQEFGNIQSLHLHSQMQS